jgi:hypothetical protein
LDLQLMKNSRSETHRSAEKVGAPQANDARPRSKGGYPEVFDFPGFRAALAIASSPGMTVELLNRFQKHRTSH